MAATIFLREPQKKRLLLSSYKFVMQLGIPSTSVQQFLVGPAFDDGAVLEQQNSVRVTNRRKAMRNDKARASLEELFQSLLNQSFCLRIDRTGRFVEN